MHNEIKHFMIKYSFSCENEYKPIIMPKTN